MQITAVDRSGQVCKAYVKSSKITPASGPSTGYKCQPPGSNHAKDAHVFEKIEDAAAFLKGHPSWGIWMRSPTRQTGLFYTDVLIDGKRR
jgi:hypothetical protein